MYIAVMSAIPSVEYIYNMHFIYMDNFLCLYPAGVDSGL
jgi:hypothetical protein